MKYKNTDKENAELFLHAYLLCMNYNINHTSINFDCQTYYNKFVSFSEKYIEDKSKK